jgi:putative peptidoglycan lipid II flippase
MANGTISAVASQTNLLKNKKRRNTIMRKVMGVGCTTLMSRILGLAREVLMGNFLGLGLSADLFFTAYKLPNSLRKIFAEGALGAALVPTCVQLMQTQSKEAVSRLISTTLLIFQGILIGVCGLIFWKAELVVRLIAPGWFVHADSILLEPTIPILGNLLRWIAPAWYIAEPMAHEILPIITYIRILIGFIVCLSSSALLAAALQAINHFFVPAFSFVLLNIIYVAGLAIGLWLGMSVTALCYLFMFGGIVQALLHFWVYFYFNFSLMWPDKHTWRAFKQVLYKFFPCLLSMSVMEINLFVSTSLATYLPSGTIASIYYANRFMGIPMGVFALALSTILLPYFSKISSYAPKRLGFYLFEASKLILWVTTPIALFLIFFSDKVFVTLFLSKKFTLAHAHGAATLLAIFASGLFFFSLNKILLNVYYALHETRMVTLVCLASSITNYAVSRLLINHWGADGLAAAFVIAGIVQSALLALILLKKYGIPLYVQQFGNFFVKTVLQATAGCFLFLLIYYGFIRTLHATASESVFSWFTEHNGLWLWTLPLATGVFMLMLLSRRWLGIRMSFLN